MKKLLASTVVVLCSISSMALAENGKLNHSPKRQPNQIVNVGGHGGKSVKYSCEVSHYLSGSPEDLKNFVRDVIVTLDGKDAIAILPISKKRVSISLSTFQKTQANINKYGEYSLHVSITEDKDTLENKEILVMTGSTFVGLDKALQILTTASYGGRSGIADVGVGCVKL